MLDELERLFWLGLTNIEIAEHFDCKQARIKDALSYHCITTRKDGSTRRNTTFIIDAPVEYREPMPMPKIKTTVAEPKSRDLDFMDAIEHRLCCWLDGNLKACGHEQFHGNRYCKHHWERSLKKNEVT